MYNSIVEPSHHDSETRWRLKDGCLISRESGKEGVCIALAETFPREVIHITLQEVFWTVSIAWIVIQAVDKFLNGKKK